MKLTHFLALLGAVLILNVVWLFAQTGAQVNPPTQSVVRVPDWGRPITNEAVTIKWVGHPVVSDNEPHFANQGWLAEYQIGFRPDGVVVWRKVKTAQ